MANNYLSQNQLMDFEGFLENDCVTVNNGSPQSYKYYINALSNYFGNIENLKFEGQNIFDAIPSIVAQDIKNETSYASTILTLLFHVPYPNKEIIGFSKKYWLNCRSALKQFIEYISSDSYQNKCVGVKPSSKKNVDNYVKMLMSVATKQVYDYNMLFAVFLSRIRTQDRYPVGGNFYFPIRILNKLFNKSNQKINWNKLLKKYIDGIKFYYKEGKTGGNIKCCVLKNINHLYIDDDGEVWITIKGVKGRKRLYTQTAAGIINKMNSSSTLPPYVLHFLLTTTPVTTSSVPLYKPQEAKSLRDINIQHDTPISVYLKNVHGSEIPNLSDLCGFIRCFCKEQDIELLQKNASEISANFDLPSNIGNREKFIAKLFNDIKKIFDLHPLSIMDEHENKSLNDKA